MLNSKQENTVLETPVNKKVKGAEAVLKCLIEEGTQYIFGYPGGAIMPVYDSLYD